MRKKWDERRGEQTYGARTISRAVTSTTAMFDSDFAAGLSGAHNDSSNTEIFKQLHDEFVWIAAWKTWAMWDRHIWHPNADHLVRIAAKDVATELMRRAALLPPDTRETKPAVKWAVSAGDFYRMNAIEKLARDQFYAEAATFDSNPYLLGCANGLIDLTTGELRDGERGDRITRTTGLNYRPNAKAVRRSTSS